MSNCYDSDENYASSSQSKSSYKYSGDNRIYGDGSGRTAHRAKVRFVKLLDVVMVSIPFILAWSLYYSHTVYLVEFFRKGNWLVIALFVII